MRQGRGSGKVGGSRREKARQRGRRVRGQVGQREEGRSPSAASAAPAPQQPRPRPHQRRRTPPRADRASLRRRMSAVSDAPPAGARSPRQHWKHGPRLLLVDGETRTPSAPPQGQLPRLGAPRAPGPLARHAASPLELPARAMAAPSSPPARPAGFHNSRAGAGAPIARGRIPRRRPLLCHRPAPPSASGRR